MRRVSYFPYQLYSKRLQLSSILSSFMRLSRHTLQFHEKMKNFRKITNGDRGHFAGQHLVGKSQTQTVYFSVHSLPAPCAALCFVSHCYHLSLRSSLVSTIVATLLEILCLKFIALSSKELILYRNFRIIQCLKINTFWKMGVSF